MLKAPGGATGLPCCKGQPLDRPPWKQWTSMYDSMKTRKLCSQFEPIAFVVNTVSRPSFSLSSITGLTSAVFAGISLTDNAVLFSWQFAGFSQPDSGLLRCLHQPSHVCLLCWYRKLSDKPGYTSSCCGKPGACCLYLRACRLPEKLLSPRRWSDLAATRATVMPEPCWSC